jgi:hypothetical protein
MAFFQRFHLSVQANASAAARGKRSGLPGLIASFALALLLALVISPVPVSAQGAGPSMDAAADWLLTLRDENGAFPGFDGTPDPGVTVDAVTALALAGRTNDLAPSLAYLEGEALVYAQTGPGSAAKLALMLIVSGQNPRDFATVDPLSIVEHGAQAGMIGFGPYDHALGLLALAAGGSAIPDAAIEAVWSSQGEEGGWAFDGATNVGAADSNTTALMIRALVATGHGQDDRVGTAASWLASLLLPEGMPYQAGGPADANSTSLALRAFDALGSGGSAGIAFDAVVDALVQFQNENGSFSWLLDPRDENVFSTVEAIPALAAVAVLVAAPTPGAEGVPASPVASPVASPEASPVGLRPAA